jgi:hypothetical protein
LSTPRQTQHRARRDGRKARELAELKKSQHQLALEARRLQDALARVERPRVVKVVAGEEPPAPKARPRGKNSCPECGGQLRLVDLGHFEMMACPDCKWHAKKDRP